MCLLSCSIDDLVWQVNLYNRADWWEMKPTWPSCWYPVLSILFILSVDKQCSQSYLYPDNLCPLELCLQQLNNWPPAPTMLWTNNGNYKHFCDSHIDGLVRGRRGSSAFTLELYLFCIEPSMWPLTVNRTLNSVMNRWYSMSVLLLVLTHWGQDECAFIYRHFQMHFLKEIIWISLNSSLKIFPSNSVHI